MNVLLVVIVGVPLLWHLGLVAVTRYDAQRVGMDKKKWTLITLAIPLFGFFMYLFERSELSYDPAEDPYARGSYHLPYDDDDDEEDEEFPEPGAAGDDPFGEGR